jgi:hypothetical protein
MNPALLLLLFATAFGTLLGAQSFIHGRYNQAMQQEAESFEREWSKLEERYAKN